MSPGGATLEEQGLTAAGSSETAARGQGLEIRILGPLEIEVDGRRLDIGPAKMRATLGMLLLHPNQVVSADGLIDAVWGTAPPSSARNVLQGYVSRLRKILGAPLISTRSPGYVLNVDPEVIDACRFERLVRAGRSAGEANEAEKACRLLTDALSLWRGAALADCGFEDFARADVARLDELRLVAHEGGFEARLALGQHASIVEALRPLAYQHPLRERLWAQLITALYRCDRQGEALRAFDELRKHLAEELGIDPSPALRELERNVLLQRPGIDFRPSPERAGTPAQDPLPTYRSTFVGRAVDLAELEEVIRAERLLTIVGPGGIGKTRLAIELARRVQSRFEHGTRLVELAALADPDLVPQVVAGALAAVEASERPLPEVLASVLGRQHVLIVLDNCEHVIGAVATVVDALLAAPGATVVATSREPLRLDGERVWRASPLALPNPQGEPLDRLATLASVRLFVDRARTHGDFMLDAGNAFAVAELCRRLDGLPLAIELAAARSPGLSPGEILAALDRRFTLLDQGARTSPERHRTLRAAVDWSHESLTFDERTIFRRLAAFSGGFTLAAARHVAAGDDIATAMIPGLLATLVDKSLLLAERRVDSTRFGMLETIREYAVERLVEARESTTVRRRHMTWYLELGPKSAFFGASPHHEEAGNIRAALQGALDDGDLATALRIIRSGGFAYTAEGWAWTDKVVAASAGAGPQLLAEALLVQGTLASMRGDSRGSIAPHREALAIFRELGDDLGTAVSLHFLAANAFWEGDHEAALRLYRESLKTWGQSGRTHGYGTAINFAHHNLGLIALEAGDLATAERHLGIALSVANELHEEGGVAMHELALGQLREVEGELDAATLSYEGSLRVARAIGFPRAIAGNLVALGRLALARGLLPSATELVLESLEVAIADRNRYGMMQGLVGLASILMEKADPERAANLLGASDRILVATGRRRAQPDKGAYERIVASVRARLGDDRFERTWEEGRRWTDDRTVAEARAAAGA